MSHRYIPTASPVTPREADLRRPLLNGRRATLADLRQDREGTIVAYPSDGEFATVHFDGDPEPVTVHKTRVLAVLPRVEEQPAHTCAARTDGAGSAYFTTEERCPVEEHATPCGEMMPGVMPNAFDVRCKEHRLDVRGVRYGHAVTTLREHREAVADGEFECEGHESLDGAHMGEAVYCDGTCRR